MTHLVIFLEAHLLLLVFRLVLHLRPLFLWTFLHTHLRFALLAFPAHIFALAYRSPHHHFFLGT